MSKTKTVTVKKKQPVSLAKLCNASRIDFINILPLKLTHKHINPVHMTDKIILKIKKGNNEWARQICKVQHRTHSCIW